MSAVIISMKDYQRDHATERALRESLVAVAQKRVLALLSGRCRNSLIADAQTIAADDVRNGFEVGRAVSHGVAWAKVRMDDDGPEVA